MKKISLIILIIVLITGTYYLYYENKPVGEDKMVSTTDDTSQYKNIERKFTLEYPKDLTIKDYDEGDTTHTITFADKDNEKSFQIFFTPYLGNQITQSRLLKDIPSGKFTEPVEIVINGSIHALAFFSTIDTGEMREVWFLHDGYLYQVTTFKDLDEWLAKIMSTWQFIQGSSAGGQ